MNISDTSKSFLKNILFLFIAQLVIGAVILFHTSYLTGYVFGLFLGTFCSAVKIFMLDLAANKSVDMDKKAAASYFRRSYYLRYLFTIAVMLIVALNHPRINLYAGALGLLNMSIGAYMYKFFNKKA